ncbi:MAG: UDP-N-acetylmuramate--L-alanine ligase [Propionicimonas sp.]|uniref:UDP-N-acetylmuramate--L-alanine ligase n=1 Tax=Propionicimonas sp. TaxID=1955623 RepID=UPI003D1428D2
MLIEPVPLVPVAELGGVHFIAIGGAGMSGVAAMYAQAGVPVSGSDQADSATLAELRDLGVRTYVGHDATQLGDATTVVVSSAVRESNPELAEARRRGLRIWHRSTALAALMAGRTGVAVTGTHGKTTTSAMAATLLAGAGADPSWVVGSPLAATGHAWHVGAGEAFVVEADESDGSFLQYPASIVVVTNIEADHLDNWGTPQAYGEGFVRLVTADAVRTVVLSADDPGTRALEVRARAAGKSVVTFGESEGADVRLSGLAYPPSGATATLTADGDTGPLTLAVPGRYNLHNAAAAYAVGRTLGLPGDLLRAGATDFAGTQRRFQPVGEARGVRVFDDYAHHPTEVAATLTAARGLVGEGRLVACFQPHLFTRTREFAGEFGRALGLADEVLVLGIYPAREDPIPGVSGRLVADAAEAAAPGRVRYVEAVADAAPALAALVGPGDLVVTLGAGDVTKVGPALARLLEQG